jgi:hypothetical protein
MSQNYSTKSVWLKYKTNRDFLLMKIIRYKLGLSVL